MKDQQRPDTSERARGRRRFLGLLTAAGVLGVIQPLRHGPERPRELSLKEADFYRRHNLVG